LINQIATYSKVNDCFISWKCFIVIYLQIHCHTNEISQFWSVCLWFSRKTNVKRNLIGYWTTKERIWSDNKSLVFLHLFLYLARVISLSGHLPGSIFSREVDIESTQNLIISFKPIICNLNYRHVIIRFTSVYVNQCLSPLTLWVFISVHGQVKLIKLYVMKFVSYLLHVVDFLRVIHQ
jgi:hypothetical protein